MQFGHRVAGVDRRGEPGSVHRIDEACEGAAKTRSDTVDGDAVKAPIW
jgi:hypothetical protein